MKKLKIILSYIGAELIMLPFALLYIGYAIYNEIADSIHLTIVNLKGDFENA